MSTSTTTKSLAAHARGRRTAVVLAIAVPWAAVATLLAWRLGGSGTGAVVALLSAIAMLLAVAGRRRGIDRDWLVRALDARQPAVQDSADLLFADAAALGPLQSLQRARVARAIAPLAPQALREPWPVASLRTGSLLAVIAALVIWFWPSTAMRTHETPAASEAQSLPDAPLQSLGAQLVVTAPDYTGVPARTLDTLDARVEEGSVLRWTLRFGIAPTAARLRFVDGDVLDLESVDGAWSAQRTVEVSTLYRIELDGAPSLPEASAHTIDVVPDLAPRVEVKEPERTLTTLDAAATRWSLVVEAKDDYALGPARLEITLAQGSGEQVTLSERSLALRGKGDAREQHFAYSFDLAGLGFAQGDDLIARVQVSDRREPTPNVTRSASFILRWPADAGMEGSGVEGLVQQAMPAYFRSQRQIIIDTEALLAIRSTLAADDAMVRSDVIGTDQRLLRLRYGQFLGEESEDVTAAQGSEEHGDEEHDHGAEAPASQGDARQALMAAAGHLHDLPEAATLLDPQTRTLLRGALDQMWQAERELRTGNTAAALPYEYRALDFIKRVQQADRIYLARVGLELPELDPARRLTGVGRPSAQRTDPLTRLEGDDAASAMWSALHGDGELPLDAFARWVDDERAALDAPLALLAEIDALRQSPACGPCRARLAAALWPVLTPPAAAPAVRARPDAVGHAYLDALESAKAMP